MRSKELLHVEQRKTLLELDSLASDIPLRHSRYQLESYVIEKEDPPDIRLKQCIRELRVRRDSLLSFQFDFAELLIRVERLEIREERLKNRLTDCGSGSFTEKMISNKLKWIHNKKKKLLFQASCIEGNFKDLMREFVILFDLAKELKGQRQFSNFEDADEAYWKGKEQKDSQLPP